MNLSGSARAVAWSWVAIRRLVLVSVVKSGGPLVVFERGRRLAPEVVEGSHLVVSQEEEGGQCSVLHTDIWAAHLLSSYT